MNTLRKNITGAICICIISLAMLGCFDKHEANTMDEIELKNETLHVTFFLPSAYKANKSSDTLLIFDCKYPDMSPANSHGIPENDDINIYITLLSDRPSEIERMVAEASDRFNAALPSKNYHSGKSGDYEIYRRFSSAGKAKQEVTTFIFRGKDGALVGVEDPGGWSRNYEAHRKIGKDIHLKYLISKNIGQDFIKIDETVATFIYNHLKTKKG